MDPPDDDIQFDFFDDEPATERDAAASRVRLPPRRSTATAAARSLGPPRGSAPLVRLLALVVVAVVFVLLVFALLI